MSHHIIHKSFILVVWFKDYLTKIKLKHGWFGFGVCLSFLVSRLRGIVVSMRCRLRLIMMWNEL